MRPLTKPISIALLAVVAILISGDAEAAPQKVKVLIVTGFDVDSHKWEESTKLIDVILRETGRFDLTISTDKEVFATLKPDDYHTVVLHYGFWNESDPSENAKAGLLNYAKAGGNIVALHFACSSFQDWKEYGILLGRVWKKGVGGHGP